MSTIKTGVLLLHGLTGVPSEMRPIEKHLQKLGYETESPTLAGHGGTQDEMFAATGADWIASAEAGFERLLERSDNVVVCGLSMGASISAILAARHKGKVSALVMLSPTLAYDLVNRTREGFDIRICHEFVREAMSYMIQVMPWLGRIIYWTETPPYGLKDERLQRQITKAIQAAQRGEDTKFGLFRTYWISLMNMNLVTRHFKREAATSTARCF
jgi:carboxylesterase